ncbi:MAG: PA14 domain-containing protein [Roseobacter sp.]
MKKKFAAALLSTTLVLPASVWAQAVTLSPADPQPSAGDLSAGLAVSYVPIPSNVRTVEDAGKLLERKGQPGAPILGLVYEDVDGKVMTSGKSEKIAADISGYIKFDAAGTYTLDFLNNDGLQLFIGGQEVAFYDGVHACGYSGEIDVDVPQAGYYPLQATFFQRKGTSCLMMEWGPDSDGLEMVTEEAFFH